MRLPRFRIRSLMIAVAAAGVVAFGEFARQRWHQCQAAARYHRQEEGRIRRAAATLMAAPSGVPSTPQERERLTALVKARWLQAALAHADRANALERSAWRPWESLPGDPPIEGGPKRRTKKKR